MNNEDNGRNGGTYIYVALTREMWETKTRDELKLYHSKRGRARNIEMCRQEVIKMVSRPDKKLKPDRKRSRHSRRGTTTTMKTKKLAADPHHGRPPNPYSTATPRPPRPRPRPRPRKKPLGRPLPRPRGTPSLCAYDSSTGVTLEASVHSAGDASSLTTDFGVGWTLDTLSYVRGALCGIFTRRLTTGGGSNR